MPNSETHPSSHNSPSGFPEVGQGLPSPDIHIPPFTEGLSVSAVSPEELAKQEADRLAREEVARQRTNALYQSVPAHSSPTTPLSPTSPASYSHTATTAIMPMVNRGSGRFSKAGNTIKNSVDKTVQVIEKVGRLVWRQTKNLTLQISQRIKARIGTHKERVLKKALRRSYSEVLWHYKRTQKDKNDNDIPVKKKGNAFQGGHTFKAIEAVPVVGGIIQAAAESKKTRKHSDVIDKHVNMVEAGYDVRSKKKEGPNQLMMSPASAHTYADDLLRQARGASSKHKETIKSEHIRVSRVIYEKITNYKVDDNGTISPSVACPPDMAAQKWVDRLNPHMVSEFKSMIVEFWKESGEGKRALPGDTYIPTARMRAGNIEILDPEVVARYFNVPEQGWLDQINGGAVVVPKKVVDALGYLIQLKENTSKDPKKQTEDYNEVLDSLKEATTPPFIYDPITDLQSLLARRRRLNNTISANQMTGRSFTQQNRAASLNALIQQYPQYLSPTWIRILKSNAMKEINQGSSGTPLPDEAEKRAKKYVIDTLSKDTASFTSGIPNSDLVDELVRQILS